MCKSYKNLVRETLTNYPSAINSTKTLFTAFGHRRVCILSHVLCLCLTTDISLHGFFLCAASVYVNYPEAPGFDAASDADADDDAEVSSRAIRVAYTQGDTSVCARACVHWIDGRACAVTQWIYTTVSLCTSPTTGMSRARQDTVPEWRRRIRCEWPRQRVAGSRYDNAQGSYSGSTLLSNPDGWQRVKGRKGGPDSDAFLKLFFYALAHRNASVYYRVSLLCRLPITNQLADDLRPEWLLDTAGLSVLAGLFNRISRTGKYIDRRVIQKENAKQY
ncbi:hypothetical protein CBL_03180 [Carabus blaptoides fortunei]